MTKVVFPCDRDSWWIVKDSLSNLKEMCLQNCDLTSIAEAHQAIVNINLGNPEGTSTYGNCIFFGLVKYFRKHATADERSDFLTLTLPKIIQLVLDIEDLLPAEGITICEQQIGETRHIDRKLCCSIIACAFLCLFPNEQRGFRTKLNNINFNKFFANLPLPSQNAKLRCILHFFERVTTEWDRLTGSVIFTRQVVKWEELPTLDTWLNCSTRLCAVKVCHEGLIEDAGPYCLEVDFANKYIGGGVLGRGRVQEEIRFTVCPELIVSMLFMEVMDINEAILIQGYEQFSLTEGYAASLQFAGSYRDTAEVDEDGNLVRTLCAIDAVSYRHDPTGQGREQYEDSYMMRDINKAFVGFCIPVSAPNGTLAEEDYFTADEEGSEDGDTSRRQDSASGRQIDKFVDSLLKQAMSLALPEAINNNKEVASGISPRSDTSTEGTSHSLPGISEEAHMSHLDVNFRDWYAHYRRRSSNLSDLSSRRSSYDVGSRRSSYCSNRGYSSEFSSEFEEYYDNFVGQEQKYKYQTIKEEVGTSVINEFAAGLAASLLKVGTYEAIHKDSELQDFHSEQPADVVNKPRPVRMSVERESDTDKTVSEAIARKFAENMFSKFWPFGDKNRTENKHVEKTEILDRIKEGCNTLTHTLQNSDNDSDKCVTDDDDNISEDEEELVEKETSKSVSVNKIWIVDENMLVEIADRIVTVAMEEGLAEYRYRYMCNQPRKLTSQISSESSQSEHSIENKDQSDATKQAQEKQSDLSNRSDSDSHKYTLPAVTVAENMVSEIFKQDIGVGRVTCPIPNKTDCDSESNSVGQPSQQYTKHSTSRSDSIKRKSDKNLEMYNRIAERLLQGEFEYKPVNNQQGHVDTAEHSNKSSEISLDVGRSHDQQNGQLELNDSYGEVVEQGLSECDLIASSHISESVIPANRSPNSLSAFIESGKSLSRSGSEKSKSSRQSEKRSLSGSSEGQGAMNVVNSSLSVYSKESENHEKCEKYSPENFNSSANHSTGSDKTGSESPVPKFKVIGPVVSSPAEGWQGARPKTTVKHAHHHVVGSKKNYDQFANSLSRDLLTNAFLQVQEHNENVYFPRRSSEPMQISNGAALQRLENSVHLYNGRRTQKSKTDEDLRECEENWIQCSFNNLRYGKNSSGFRDPLLSRFAEELMKANVSVPQLQLLTDCVSTSGSSRSVCSTIGSFKDPLLASFEEELLSSNTNKMVAKTQMSWSKMKTVVCSPRLNDRHMSQNNNNNNNSNSYQGNSNITSQKVRVNSISIDSEASNLSQKSNPSNSMLLCPSEIAEFAEMLARRILCEAYTAAVCIRSGSLHNSRSRMTLDMYSEMLAGSIIQSAIYTVENEKLCSEWLEQSKMSHGPIVTWSDETECLEYSGEDEEISSTETDSDRLSPKSGGSSSLEYEDALDIPYKRLEQFADLMAAQVLVNSVAVMKREKVSSLRKQYGRPIATGNWGCGAFRGDPQLKSILQWMAASYAGAPELIYYTFNNPKMGKFQDVIETINYRGWDVAQLMQAVRRYCITTENEIRLTGANSRDLFDVIIQGEVFPGT